MAARIIAPAIETAEPAPGAETAPAPATPTPVMTPRLAARPWRLTLAKRARRGLRAHLAVVLVLAAFAASAFVVPTLMNVATTDDWGYTRSVEILLDEGRLTVLPAVAATAVFQILWGALFGTVFGMSLGVMRLATVVMVALGGVALYALARDLGVTRGRAALGDRPLPVQPADLLARLLVHDRPLLYLAAHYQHRALRPRRPAIPGR